MPANISVAVGGTIRMIKLAEKSKSLLRPGNDLILGDRARKSLYIEGELSGCDVCWTCCRFNFNTNNCSWITIGDKPLYINKPDWFRCIYWNEQDN